MEQPEEREEEEEKSRPVPPKVKEEEKDFKLSTRVVTLLFGGDISSPGQTLEKWLALVRKRSGTFRPSGFPRRNLKIEAMPSDCLSLLSQGDYSEKTDIAESVAEADFPGCDLPQEMSLWDRLGNAATLDIEMDDFTWDVLSSLHHTEHSSSSEHSEDEMCKALEVTVNSGGVVFFALFNSSNNDGVSQKEAAAVIKFSSSKMATQAVCLGYEFATWLGVRTPQARVIHNSSPEWQQIRNAAEKAQAMAVSNNDEVGEMTCSELLEALELSRCLLLMSYVHGSPLLGSPKAFDSREAAGVTAAALGRVLMLDLILRNEDRLPCRQLGWRGNPANLMISDGDRLEDANSSCRSYNPLINRVFQKERRSSSANGRLDAHESELLSPNTDALKRERENSKTKDGNFDIVAIDTGVPRRPPAGKRAKDQERYPKVVELILNNSQYSSNILYEISGGRLGLLGPEELITSTNSCSTLSDGDMAAVVHEFRGGFRAALRELEGFHLFILQLHQKLDGLLRVFLSIITKSIGESDGNDIGISDFPSPGFCINSPCPTTKQAPSDVNGDSETQKSTPKSSSAGSRGSSDSASPMSRDNWSSRYFKGNGETPRSLRMTMKLRDFQKVPKMDPELLKEIEQWNEALRTDVIKFCQDNNFHTGFFDGTEGNMVVDAYELKVRLEHITERIALISDAANTERPSRILGNLFIGGALAARSIYTLQHLGITHILCLCSNEIGQSDSQYPDLFEYRNFSISDADNANISDLFEEASDYIDHVERSGGKVLVHCFEGKSRSATVVLAYLMLRKGYTLAKAWNMLKKAHRRAQPNDGFAKILLELDRRLHGKASMDWQHRRPEMKVCPICSKNVGLSTSSLKLHLQKAHKRLSSGSVDSAMTMEIQKTLESLRISRGGSLSPTQKLTKSFADQLSM